jgi:Domain of unknown function (DUF5666)
MNIEFRELSSEDRPRLGRTAITIATIAVLMLLAACGGDTKTGGGGTGSIAASEDPIVASGSVNSLGPVGVGSVTLTDATALVQINAAAPKSISELRLGMQAEISGSILANAASGTASAITTQSAVIGPVTSVDRVNNRLNVLSLTIQVDQNTILEGLASLAAIGPGARVEVFGPQASISSILARRLVLLPSSSTTVELLGTASNLSGNQLSVQGVQILAAGAQVSTGGIPNPIVGQPGLYVPPNSRVRVIGSYDSASNTLTATQLVSGLNPVRNDNSLLMLDGLVQSVTAAGRFRLNDTDVDASAVGGTTAIAGAQVQVRGRKQAGVLVANEYRLIAPNERIAYNIDGDISDFASVASFRVRGELISANSASIVGGNASALGNGKRVRVRVVAGAGILEATQVTLVNP